MRFTTAAALVSELIDARDEKHWLRFQKQLAAYELLLLGGAKAPLATMHRQVGVLERPHARIGADRPLNKFNTAKPAAL